MTTENTTTTDVTNRYVTFRHFRVETLDGNPTLIGEYATPYADVLTTLIRDGHNVILIEPDGAFGVYKCPSPMHSIAMIAILHASQYDDDRAAEQAGAGTTEEA